MQEDEEQNLNIEEEIEFVPESGEDLKVADPIKKIADLKAKLKASEQERLEYLDNWQRERAAFLNYKKDESARAQKVVAYSREEFVNELLPVLDSYDMAFSNKEAWEKVEKNWRIGVEYIHAQLLKVLADNGVNEINVQEGDMFDHAIHQSVESVEIKDKLKDQTISKVMQKGYRTKDGILRPARVNVFSVK